MKINPRTMTGTVSVAASSAVSFSVKPKLGTAELLFNCAQSMGLSPVWLTPKAVFVIVVNGQERYVNLARSPLNSASSAALAKNKYVTRRILERHKMPNIPFTIAHTASEAEAFLKTHSTIVAKPVTGSGTRDIHIINKTTQLSKINVNQYILEKYIAGRELRFLILNSKVVGVHRSEYGTSVAKDRPLQRISFSKCDWDSSLVALSKRIAKIFSLQFVAIDYLIDDSQNAYILEINTMPGLKWFHAPSSGPVVNIAELFLESIVRSILSEQKVESNLDLLNSTFSYNEFGSATL